MDRVVSIVENAVHQRPLLSLALCVFLSWLVRTLVQKWRVPKGHWPPQPPVIPEMTMTNSFLDKGSETSVFAFKLQYTRWCHAKSRARTGFDWVPDIYKLDIRKHPNGYPVVGHLPLLMSSDPARSSMKWSQKLGDTILLKYGPKPLVVLHNYETAKEVFSAEATTGRDSAHLTNVYAKDRGIQQGQHDVWRSQRDFVIRSLRDNGMGKNYLEEHILAEVDDLLTKLSEFATAPCDPKTAITKFCANIVSHLALGHRVEASDENFKQVIGCFRDIITGIQPLTLVHVYPVVRFWPFMLKKWRKYTKAWRSVLKYLDTLIVEEKVSSSDDFIRKKSYICDFLEEGKRLRRQGSSDTSFTEDQLLFALQNLYTGGTETVAISLLWTILYLAIHPEVLKKAQDEISQYVAPGDVVRLENRYRLKYCEAVMLEIQRCSSISPMGIMHRNLSDIQIDGYEVPKDTLLMVNIFSIHHDERYWQKPYEFIPERFLDENGNVKIPKGFLPFSIGKRACPGESLAKQEIYLVVTNLLNRFDICVPEDKTISPDNHVAAMVVRAPKPFHVVFKERSS